jgi:hypothetical protein
MGRRLLEPLALAGSVTVIVAISVLVWRWDPISAGHPSYLVFYLSATALSVAVVVTVLSRGRSKRPALSTIGAIGLVIVGLAAWWLAPFPADEVALEELSDPDGIAVTETSGEIILEPESDKPPISLTFYPGARIDARAYVLILSPLARSGIEVTIVKPPLGIALLASAVSPPRDTDTWVVGGHSLGGVSASAAVERGADGLLLWASFPASDLSDHTGIDVSSVYGTADTFTTPSDVRGSEPDLPPGSAFVPVEGGIHSFFGDYGIQPGDGVPGIPRDEAREQIGEASLELIRSIGD